MFTLKGTLCFFKINFKIYVYIEKRLPSAHPTSITMEPNYESDMASAREASRRSYIEELDRMNRAAFEKGLQMSLASEEAELVKQLSLESYQKESTQTAYPSYVTKY